MHHQAKVDEKKLAIWKSTTRFFSSCNHIQVIQNWNKRVIYVRQFETPQLTALLCNPDKFIQSGHCLKDGDSTTVTCVQLGNEQFVIKRYNILSYWHAFRRAFRASRAAHCWHNAHLLNHYQLHTPSPVAMVEQRWGPIRRKAYYIMRFEAGESGLSVIKNANVKQRERVLLDLHDDMQIMYANNISHGDLKANNLLWTDQSAWSWLDLDGMRQYRSSLRFAKAWRKDMRRWLKNWREQPEIEQQIKHIFEWL
ncbi:MAG: lipopolysaccharide kinase InaA family protein [Methylococcales bacterium]